jgi:hypothetical protein
MRRCQPVLSGEFLRRGPMKRQWFTVAVIVTAALVTSTPATLSVADEQSVVVSRPGTVFHRPEATDVRGRGYSKTLGSALAAGYSPCAVCYASTASGRLSAPRLGAGGAAAVAEGGPGYGVPPKSVTEATQPFGLKQPSTHRSGLGKGAVKNPFVDPETLRDPGPEQGAYATID